MDLPLTFREPYSGHEILLLKKDHSNGILGIIYHPLVVSPPTPWQSSCRHCVAGQQRGLDLCLKRAVQLLCTWRESTNGAIELTVPSNSQPHHLECKTDEHGWCVRVTRPDTEKTLDVIYRPREGTTFSGKPREFQSDVLRRCLKLLFTCRRPSTSEVTACLSTLMERQRKEGIAARRRHPCLKVDWNSVWKSVCANKQIEMQPRTKYQNQIY